MFQKRLAFCTQRLETAKKCLRGGFTPVEDFIKQQKQLKLKAGEAGAEGMCKAKILELAVKLKNRKQEQINAAAAAAAATAKDSNNCDPLKDSEE